MDSTAPLADFAARVATRDDPPMASPAFFTPEAMRGRIGQALAARLSTLDPRRIRTLGRLGFALTQATWQTNAQLAAATGHTPQAMQRVADGLVKIGVIEVFRDKNTRIQRLTRAGEDLLLALMQGAEPPVG